MTDMANIAQEIVARIRQRAEGRGTTRKTLLAEANRLEREFVEKSDCGIKRYAVFGGEHYYPLGGWEDYSTSFSSVDEARSFVDQVETFGLGAWEWGQIVDLKERNLVMSLAFDGCEWVVDDE